MKQHLHINMKFILTPQNGLYLSKLLWPIFILGHFDFSLSFVQYLFGMADKHPYSTPFPNHIFLFPVGLEMPGLYQKSCTSFQCSVGMVSDRACLSVWSQQDLQLVRVFIWCLKALLKRFRLIRNLLYTLLLGRLLATFSPHRDARLAWLAAQVSLDFFLFVVKSASEASSKIDVASSTSLFSRVFRWPRHWNDCHVVRLLTRLAKTATFFSWTVWKTSFHSINSSFLWSPVCKCCLDRFWWNRSTRGWCSLLFFSFSCFLMCLIKPPVGFWNFTSIALFPFMLAQTVEMLADVYGVPAFAKTLVSSALWMCMAGLPWPAPCWVALGFTQLSILENERENIQFKYFVITEPDSCYKKNICESSF